MAYDKKFDFKRFLSLGREVSQKHEEFKKFAPLSNDYAEKRASLMFWVWLQKNQKASIEEKLEKLIDLRGKAQMLQHVKEVGRLCLILGDTSRREDWKD